MIEKMKKLPEVLSVIDKNKDFMDPAMYERLTIEITRDAPDYYVGPTVACEGCIYRSQYSNDDGLFKCGAFSRGNLQILVPPDGWCFMGRSKGTNSQIPFFPLPYFYPVSDYEGLKLKYIVYTCDTGEIVDGCFVLRPDKDEAAKVALLAYAEATDNKQLASDIRNWITELQRART